MFAAEEEEDLLPGERGKEMRKTMRTKEAPKDPDRH